MSETNKYNPDNQFSYFGKERRKSSDQKKLEFKKKLFGLFEQGETPKTISLLDIADLLDITGLTSEEKTLSADEEKDAKTIEKNEKIEAARLQKIKQSVRSKMMIYFSTSILDNVLNLQYSRWLEIPGKSKAAENLIPAAINNPNLEQKLARPDREAADKKIEDWIKDFLSKQKIFEKAKFNLAIAEGIKKGGLPNEKNIKMLYGSLTEFKKILFARLEIEKQK